ncbi:MAG: MFS transporter [Caldilineaceae bacterium]
MNQNSGFRTFLIIWAGQFVSMLGTGMTRFALLIWAYQQTGSATTLALLGFFAWLPFIIVSPIAGVWVDRLDRRRVMIWADVGSALLSVFVLTMLLTGHLAIWQIYLLEGMSSLFDAFQLPAYMASVSTLLDKKDYARANGLRSLAFDGTQIVAPILAGLLLPWIGIGGVMTIDLSTFVVAMITLLIVAIPLIPKSNTGGEESFWHEVRFGSRFIFARPGLLGLMLIFAGIEFFATLTYFAVLPTLILKRTGGDEGALGLVQATLGAAGVVGGILVSTFGLPKRKIHAVLAGCGLSFLFGDFLFAIGRSLSWWMVAAAVAAVFIPFIVSADRTIWQNKVPPSMQGRVFSTSNAVRWGTKPIAFLIAGPIADRLLEPAMQAGGALAPIFGWLVGTGAGAGIALMFVGTSIFGSLISFGGYLVPALRNVETALPDHDETHSQDV